MPRGSASFEASRHVKIEALPDAKAMKRTTLAYANSKRDYHIFEKFYLYLVDYFARSFQLRLENKERSNNNLKFSMCDNALDDSLWTLSCLAYKFSLSHLKTLSGFVALPN